MGGEVDVAAVVRCQCPYPSSLDHDGWCQRPSEMRVFRPDRHGSVEGKVLHVCGDCILSGDRVLEGGA